MEIRTAYSPEDEKYYDTKRLRREFLIDDLFKGDEIKLVYSHIDRIITGSAVPVNKKLVLTAGDELRAEYFQPAVEDMINDAFLGLSVIALALIVWVLIILVKDPLGTVKKSLKK